MKLSKTLLASRIAFAGPHFVPAAGPLPQKALSTRRFKSAVSSERNAQQCFRQTEVLQRFFNPNAQDLEAVYAFPAEKRSLSEVTIVTAKDAAREVSKKAEAEQSLRGGEIGR